MPRRSIRLARKPAPTPTVSPVETRSFVTPAGAGNTLQFSTTDTLVAGDVVTFNNNVTGTHLNRVEAVKYGGTTSSDVVEGVGNTVYGNKNVNAGQFTRLEATASGSDGTSYQVISHGGNTPGTGTDVSTPLTITMSDSTTKVFTNSNTANSGLSTMLVLLRLDSNEKVVAASKLDSGVDSVVATQTNVILHVNTAGPDDSVFVGFTQVGGLKYGDASWMSSNSGLETNCAVVRFDYEGGLFVQKWTTLTGELSGTTGISTIVAIQTNLSGSDVFVAGTVVVADSSKLRVRPQTSAVQEFNTVPYTSTGVRSFVLKLSASAGIMDTTFGADAVFATATTTVGSSLAVNTITDMVVDQANGAMFVTGTTGLVGTVLAGIKPATGTQLIYVARIPNLTFTMSSISILATAGVRVPTHGPFLNVEATSTTDATLSRLAVVFRSTDGSAAGTIGDNTRATATDGANAISVFSCKSLVLSTTVDDSFYEIAEASTGTFTPTAIVQDTAGDIFISGQLQSDAGSTTTTPNTVHVQLNALGATDATKVYVNQTTNDNGIDGLVVALRKSATVNTVASYRSHVQLAQAVTVTAGSTFETEVLDLVFNSDRTRVHTVVNFLGSISYQKSSTQTTIVGSADVASQVLANRGTSGADILLGDFSVAATNLVFGVTKAPAVAGVVDVYLAGQLAQNTALSLTVAKRYYVSATTGALVTASSGNTLVGFSLGTDQLLMFN